MCGSEGWRLADAHEGVFGNHRWTFMSPQLILVFGGQVLCETVAGLGDIPVRVRMHGDLR